MHELVQSMGQKNLAHGCREIHAQVIHHRMDDGTITGNASMDKYNKSGGFDSALKIFSRIGVKDLVSWTSIILGYSLQGDSSFSFLSPKEEDE